MIKAASYARFSSDTQREESAEAQLSDNRKYADKNNMIIVKEYVDRGISGRSDARGEFQRMIADAKQGKFGVVIVHKVDRFARNRYDAAVYKSILKKLGIRVVYAVQPIEDSPEGALMEGILESFAEYYSLNLAAEVMKGLNENAKKARFNGGTPPLGYDIDENKHYIINKKESYIVKEIFDSYASGEGYTSIANTLNSKGYKNKRGKPFVFNSIPGILKNKKYIGIYEFNKTTRKYKDGKRNLKKFNDEKDIIRIEGAIPKIVSAEVFQMAQKEIKRRSKGRGKSRSVRNYFLSGLIVCKKCDRSVTGYSQKRSKESKRYFYYRCPGCNVSIRAEEIEAKAVEQLDQLVFANLDDLLDEIHEYVSKKEEDTPDEIKYLQSEIDKTSTEISNIIQMISKGVSSMELGRKLEELESYKTGLEDRLKDINVQSQIPEDALREWLLSIQSDFDKSLNLKKIARTFIKEIRLTKETYEIDFFMEAPQNGASRYSVAPSAPQLLALTRKYIRNL